MFGLGGWEIAIVIGVGVLLFGSQLPSVARNIGRTIPSLKKGMQEVQEEITEVKQVGEKLESDLRETIKQ